jgi:hypothetical protein
MCFTLFIGLPSYRVPMASWLPVSSEFSLAVQLEEEGTPIKWAAHCSSGSRFSAYRQSRLKGFFGCAMNRLPHAAVQVLRTLRKKAAT